MSWRSPYQTAKSGGVPFPALTPWANSPAQPSDPGSPMQTSPTPMLKSLATRGTTNLRRTSVGNAVGKASPMDAAPYTPLSAAHGLKPQIVDRAKFVGKLSFTPHANHRSHTGFSPASKRAASSSPDQRSTSDKPPAQPPVSSMYANSTVMHAVTQTSSEKESNTSGQQSFESYACYSSPCSLIMYS